MLIPLVFAATLVASESRCNDVVASQLQDQVRGFDAHRPADADLATRLGALQDVVDRSNEEHDVLAHVCPAGDLPPLASELQAVQGWAYAQQADIVHREFASSCPGSADAVAAGFLAEGWRRIAKASAPESGKPDSLAAKVAQTIQAQAIGLKLTLPAVPETSDYWVKGVQDQGRAAAASCPTPPA